MSENSTTRCGRCGTIDGCVCKPDNPSASRTRPPANPPAFPSPAGSMMLYPGLTMRDHFAGQALPTYCKIVHAHPDAKGWTNEALNRAAATMAYDMADAMLAAREVKS